MQASCCLWVIVPWGAVFVRRCASLFVGGHFHPCAFIFVCAHSSSFMCVHFHLWVVSFVRVHLFQCGGAMLVSWWRHVAIRGVAVWWLVVWSSWGVVATRLWRFIVICHCGSCDMAPASHVKKRWGVGGYGTHLHEQ